MGRDALWLLGAGLTSAWGGSVAVRSVVVGQLYGVKPLDPNGDPYAGGSARLSGSGSPGYQQGH